MPQAAPPACCIAALRGSLPIGTSSRSSRPDLSQTTIGPSRGRCCASCCASFRAACRRTSLRSSASHSHCVVGSGGARSARDRPARTVPPIGRVSAQPQAIIAGTGSCLSVGVTDRSLAATGAAAARVADSGRPSRKIPIARAGQRVHRDDTVRLCHPARSTRHAAHAGQRKGERRSNHSAVRRQAGLGRRADIGISAAQCWLHCCRRDARAAGRPGPRPATSTSASSRAVARGASAPLRARAARGRRVRTSFASCSLLACAMGSCRHAYDDMGGGAMGIAPLRRSCCTQSAAAELEGVAAEPRGVAFRAFLTR